MALADTYARSKCVRLSRMIRLLIVPSGCTDPASTGPIGTSDPRSPSVPQAMSNLRTTPKFVRSGSGKLCFREADHRLRTGSRLAAHAFGRHEPPRSARSAVRGSCGGCAAGALGDASVRPSQDEPGERRETRLRVSVAWLCPSGPASSLYTCERPQCHGDLVAFSVGMLGGCALFFVPTIRTIAQFNASYSPTRGQQL
jgi:hypothetical protein